MKSMIYAPSPLPISRRRLHIGCTFRRVALKPDVRTKLKRIAIGSSPIAAVCLLVLTGAQKWEVLSLKWSDISPAAQIATIADAKEMPIMKGKAVGQKTLMLSPAALDLLRKLQ